MLSKKKYSTPYIFHLIPYLLHFYHPIKTSRGSITEKKIYFLIREYQNFSTKNNCHFFDYFQIGEAGYLSGLTLDCIEDYPQKIKQLGEASQSDLLDSQKFEKISSIFHETPALLSAWEMLLFNQNFNTHSHILTPPDTSKLNQNFYKGNLGIPINGLVWMGELEYQKQQIINLLKKGFHTIKLKIGSLDFNKELELIDFIFTQSQKKIPVVRLDANGAFSPNQALTKLEKLSRFPIHSIEQPLPPFYLKSSYKEKNQLIKVYQKIFQQSPIPIALDEELIGITQLQDKKNLLDSLQPHYLVLKPGVHGGFSHCEEWIGLAEKKGIGWWISSALESNLGLTTISHWTANMISLYNSNNKSDKKNIPINSKYSLTQDAQGLGTGGLFKNNFFSPLTLKEDILFYDYDKDFSFKKDLLQKINFLP